MKVMSPEIGRRSAAKALDMPWPEYQAHVEAGERRCYACRRWRPVALFRLRRQGSTARHSHCADCFREYMREYMRRGVHYATGADQ